MREGSRAFKEQRQPEFRGEYASCVTFKCSYTQIVPLKLRTNNSSYSCGLCWQSSRREIAKLIWRSRT